MWLGRERASAPGKHFYAGRRLQPVAEVNRSVLVSFKPEQMYDLVDAVEDGGSSLSE